MFEVLLLFLPTEDTNDEVWLSSKSPPLTLLEGDVARLLFKAMTKPWDKDKNCTKKKITEDQKN